MKAATSKLLRNRLFIMLLQGVFAYTAFYAIIIATLNIPPDAILDTNLREVILIFEDYD